MYIIRDIFQTKPGKAKNLVAMFKKSMALMEKEGVKTRVMTDTVAGYWTVVCESEVSELEKYFRMGQQRNPEMEKAMEGYMDLLIGGRREIFRIE
jgi:hypothetical protein